MDYVKVMLCLAIGVKAGIIISIACYALFHNSLKHKTKALSAFYDLKKLTNDDNEFVLQLASSSPFDVDSIDKLHQRSKALYGNDARIHTIDIVELAQIIGSDLDQAFKHHRIRWEHENLSNR